MDPDAESDAEPDAEPDADESLLLEDELLPDELLPEELVPVPPLVDVVVLAAAGSELGVTTSSEVR